MMSRRGDEIPPPHDWDGRNIPPPPMQIVGGWEWQWECESEMKSSIRRGKVVE